MIFDPFEEIRRLQERMNRLFEEIERIRLPELRFAEVPVDVIDEGNQIKVIADLPGFKKEDIEIFLEENDLVIKAERKEEEEEKGKNFLKRERRYGRFYKRVALPPEAETDKIKARYNNGVLEVIIPKVEKERKTIPIE